MWLMIKHNKSQQQFKNTQKQTKSIPTINLKISVRGLQNKQQMGNVFCKVRARQANQGREFHSQSTTMEKAPHLPCVHVYSC